jgi:hypothetical protein
MAICITNITTLKKFDSMLLYNYEKFAVKKKVMFSFSLAITLIALSHFVKLILK